MERKANSGSIAVEFSLQSWLRDAEAKADLGMSAVCDPLRTAAPASTSRNLLLEAEARTDLGMSAVCASSRTSALEHSAQS